MRPDMHNQTYTLQMSGGSALAVLRYLSEEALHLRDLGRGLGGTMNMHFGELADAAEREAKDILTQIDLQDEAREIERTLAQAVDEGVLTC